MAIVLKTESEQQRMIQAGGLTGEVLTSLIELVAPGISTMELDNFAEKEIRRLGGTPTFKGYRGFPASICTSPNDVIVHGIPSKYTVLREGDIVGIDIGVNYEGLNGDSAVTVPVGEITPTLQYMIDAAVFALEQGIKQVEDGNRIGDVADAIQNAVQGRGRYGIVREYGGHGIGRALHEDPIIPNFGLAGTLPKLQTGMAVALEPMITLGTHATRLDPDGWAVRTADGFYSAHVEHTVLLTPEGPIVTTIRDSEIDSPKHA